MDLEKFSSERAAALGSWPAAGVLGEKEPGSGMAGALAVLGLPEHEGAKEDKYAAAAGVALPKKRWARASVEVSRAGQGRASQAIDGSKGLAGVLAAAAAINDRKKLLLAAGMDPGLAEQDRVLPRHPNLPARMRGAMKCVARLFGNCAALP